MGNGAEPGGDNWVVKDDVKLHRSGNSVVVTLPQSIRQEAMLQEGDEVELVADRESRSITIQLKGME